MKKLIFLLFFSLTTCLSVLACSCSKVGKLTKRDLADGEVTFVGRVIEVTYLDDYTMKTSFRLEENLTNEPLGQIFEVWSARDCEPDFISGDQWYIFTYVYDGKHWSGLCSRSAQLTDRVIPENPYKEKYRRQAQRRFNQNQRRAVKEIKQMRKLKARNPR